MDWKRLLGCVAMLACSGLLSGTVRVRAEPPDRPARQELAVLVELIGQQEDPDFQLDLLRGMLDGLEGQREVPAPAGWAELAERLGDHPRDEMRQVVRQLGLVFGDQQALAQLLEQLADRELSADKRHQALRALVARNDPRVLESLLELLDDSTMRIHAMGPLAGYSDPQIPRRLLELYAELSSEEKQRVVLTLAARADFARTLLDAVEQGRVPQSDVSAFAARQMVALGDGIRQRVEQVWGSVRASSEDKQRVQQRYRQLLTDPDRGDPDLVRGRLLFQQTCQKCHRLFGEGETIGPDLSGTNRMDLDYLLENMIDPNALVGKDYQLHTLELDDGRVVSGIVVGADAKVIRLQTVDQRIVVPRDSIELMQESPVSMMPEGQLADLTIDQVRDLIGYLQAPRQVPLPPDGSLEQGR